MARNKFHNIKIEIDGYTFDSQAEGRRWVGLKLMEYAGEISGLLPHPQYLIHEGFRDSDGRKWKHMFYVADFQYSLPDGTIVVEDVKSDSTRTAVFQIKQRLFRQRYPHLKFMIVDSKDV